MLAILTANNVLSRAGNLRSQGSPILIFPFSSPFVVNPDLFIIVGCTVAGGVLGGLRGLRMISVGGHGPTRPLRPLIQGLIVGVLIGLLINELKDLNIW
jgi:hypothetical protein